jgi:predicted lipoprotein with Yx(FWY)xxD motif
MEMSKKIVVAAVAALALAAAGAAAAAVVTHQSSRSLASARLSGARVVLHTTKLGKVLATSSGKTLYLFMADHNGRSACYGKCATFWPPLLASKKPSAGPGVSASKLGLLKRTNGTHQVTYAGHPLYGFKLDKSAGQISGQRQDFFGGEWYIVAGSGKAIKKAAPSTGTTTGSTTGTTDTTTTRY